MEKSKINIEATLEVILNMLRYFENMPDSLDEQKKYIKRYNNIKQRMKLLINDIYDYMVKNEGFASGISTGVKDAIDNKLVPKRIWEHPIPWKVFFQHLIKKKFTSTTELFDYIKITFCQCWITSDENKRLDKAKLKSKMPEGWQSWRDRYDDPKVKIKLAVEPYNPSNSNLDITPDHL